MIGHRSAKRKNVLLILADQFRWDCIGAYGAQVVRTPRLDRLAAEGLLYERAYCTQPVCSPSRASLLTGKYPHEHGLTSNNMTLDAGVPTIAEVAREAGYFCGYVGKWHLGEELKPQRGFTDFWTSIEDLYDADSGRGLFSSYHHYLIEQGFLPDRGEGANKAFSRQLAARMPEAHGKPAFVAAQTRSFLERSGSGPWLLAVSFLEPHMPFFGPFDDVYDPSDVVLPQSWSTEMDDTVPERYRIKRAAYARSNRHLSEYRASRDGVIPAEGDANDELGWRRIVARYWGLCSLVDKYVGRVLDSLEERGLADDTVVAFTTDHGEMMGEHRLLGKSVQYEPSVRVPLIVRSPGQSPARITEPVSQAGLAGTLLTAAGVTVPPEMAASGSLPPWGQPTEPGIAVVEWNGPLQLGGSAIVDSAAGGRQPAQPARTVITQRWKLSVYDSGEMELFDLDSDPSELRNLATDPRYADVRAGLLAALHRWQERTNDDFVLSDAARL